MYSKGRSPTIDGAGDQRARTHTPGARSHDGLKSRSLCNTRFRIANGREQTSYQLTTGISNQKEFREEPGLDDNQWDKRLQETPDSNATIYVIHELGNFERTRSTSVY